MKPYAFDAPSGKISYQVFGQGQTLLLLAGGPGLRADYLEALWTELSKTHQVIVLHQRGTDPASQEEAGPEAITLDAYLDDIDALRRHLQLKTWHVLGHSWGGMLASAYCAGQPEAVEKLILINSAGLHYSIFGYLVENLIQRLSGSEYARAMELAGKLQTEDGAAWAIEFFKALTPAYFFDKSKAVEFASRIDAQFLSFPAYGMIVQDVVSRQLDLREKAALFPGPVLSIHARQDMVGFQTHYDIRSSYPQVQVGVIEQAGHYCWLEQPAACFNLIHSFLTH